MDRKWGSLQVHKTNTSGLTLAGMGDSAYLGLLLYKDSQLYFT